MDPKLRIAPSAFVLIAMAVSAFFWVPRSQAETPERSASVESVEALETLTRDYLERVAENEPYLKLLSGEPIERLPDRSLAFAQQQASESREQLAALARIERSLLSHQDRLTAAIFEGQLRQAVEGVDHYWLQFDVTPYQGGFVFSTLLPPALRGARLGTAAEVDVYLGLVADVGRYVGEQAQKLRGQDERGILLPKAAIPGVVAVYEGLRDDVPTLARVDEGRLAGLSVEERQRLHVGVAKALEEEVLPAIDELLAILGPSYRERAPEAVGLGQYPGGSDYYRFLIGVETTLDLDPETIHRQGLELMADLRRQKAEVRKQLGFTGSAQEFHTQMRQNPRFYAASPAEVEERFDAYIARIEPRIGEVFSLLPKAPYGVQRLDPSAEAGMTYGYYQSPNPLSEKGLYRYNGSDLDSRPMVWAGALIYHELIPGHHFHLALQRENPELSDYRQRGALFSAFNEGWANYAASVAVEMGLLDDPWDRYGWLLFDSFITARLVLDTGMNHLGWSLEEARAYMLENTFASEAEVATETLRYSTDLPAQALAYKLGFETIRRIRAQAAERWPAVYDIRQFHAAAVGSGALPMPLLEEHVHRHFEQLAGAQEVGGGR